MSQFDFGTINPDTKSGSGLASDLNSWRNALHSMHRGSTRPTYAVQGMMWIDDSASPWQVKMYNGGSLGTDTTVATYDEVTGVYTPVNVTAGAVSVVDPSKAIGYGTGAGGTVTQATSKSTTVTLNKPCGRITMHTEALAAGATVQFNCNNTLVSTTDLVILNVAGGVNYSVWGHCVAGVIVIYVRNISGVSLADAASINFAIIKGATS